MYFVGVCTSFPITFHFDLSMVSKKFMKRGRKNEQSFRYVFYGYGFQKMVLLLSNCFMHMNKY